MGNLTEVAPKCYTYKKEENAWKDMGGKIADGSSIKGEVQQIRPAAGYPPCVKVFYFQPSPTILDWVLCLLLDKSCELKKHT